MFLLLIISCLTKRLAVERGRKVLFCVGADVDVQQQHAVRRGRPC